MIRENEMIATLIDVSERLARLDIDYMVTGSFAMAAYVTARTTMDIDLVLRLGTVRPSEFERAFAGAYYVNASSVARASKNESVFNIINNTTLVKVECIVGRKDAWETDRFTRRIKTKLGDIEFWIIGKEDLIVAKAKWAYASLSERQFQDVAALVESGASAERLYQLIADGDAQQGWEAFQAWTTRVTR